VTAPLPAGATVPAPTALPSIPGLAPVVPPVGAVADPTSLIPASLAQSIQQLAGLTPGTVTPAPPCRQQPPFTVQGRRSQFPRVGPDAAGTGPIGP
jgi:hypothetical protein